MSRCSFFLRVLYSRYILMKYMDTIRPCTSFHPSQEAEAGPDCSFLCYALLRYMFTVKCSVLWILFFQVYFLRSLLLLSFCLQISPQVSDTDIFFTNIPQLGIPTANIPPDGLSAYPDLQTGVYYGVVALDPAKFIYDKNESTAHTVADGDSNSAPGKQEPATILPAVLSIGYNPFYKNTVRSVVCFLFLILTISFFFKLTFLGFSLNFVKSKSKYNIN